MERKQIVEFLNNIEFSIDKDNFYTGMGSNSGDDLPFKFNLFANNIICLKDNTIVFQLPFKISLGTLLVVCQEFGIIHERYIYERVYVIEETFEENEE